MKITVYCKKGRKYTGYYIPICKYREYTIYFFPDKENGINNFSYTLTDIESDLPSMEMNIEDSYIHEAIIHIFERYVITNLMFDIDRVSI